MVFQLIQLPISIIFIAIFALVCLLVLWKLRKNGRVYRLLFWLCLAGAGVFFVFAVDFGFVAVLGYLTRCGTSSRGKRSRFRCLTRGCWVGL